MKKLAVFDLDGTLHDSSAALTPAIAQAFEETGIVPLDPARVESLYGQPMNVLLPELVPDPALRPAFLEAFRRIQQETVPGSGRLYPGVREMLEKLRADGWKTAVCSNAGLPYVELVLGALGIRGMIDRAEGLGGYGSKALSLAGMLAEEAPSVAVMIGDRYLDFEAARASGLPSIGCAWGFGDAGELRLADAVASCPPEIPLILEELFQKRISLRSG